MIEPRQVADAILHAAEHHTRDKRVGSMAKLTTTMATLFPGLADRMMVGQVKNLTTDGPPKHP